MLEIPDTVLDAIKTNKSLIVSQWLNNLQDISEGARPALVQVIQQSSHFLSTDVIKLFQTPELPRNLLHEIINAKDLNGKTAIHYAAESCLVEKGSKHTVLEVLTHLYEQGGDPTIISKQGKTAQIITEEYGNKIAAALLEVLGNMQCQVSRRSSALEYKKYEINAVHKTLLHWAVFTERHHIVSQILIMHQRDSYDSIAHLMFDSDPNSAKSYQSAPIFTASEIGNPKLFEVLVTQSGIPHCTAIKKKQKHEILLPDDTVKQYFVTPLSLILSKPENHNLIDVLVDFEEKLFNDRRITSVDLSDTWLSSLPIELFKLGVYKLNLQNNELSTLPLLLAPRSCWPNRLQELNISYNSIKSLPTEVFKLPCLETLNVSHNPLKSLPEKWWNTKSIKEFNISYTNLESLSINIADKIMLQTMKSASTLPNSTKVVHGKVSTACANSITSKVVKTDSLLQHLNASHCEMATFPKLLAVFFPKLEYLNLSNNKLESCCAINELPISLNELDISNNLLQYSKHKLFCTDAQLAVKSIYMEHKDLCFFSSLRLSNNTSLGSLTICEKDDRVFFPNLKKLYISNCNLKQTPERLVDLQELTDLDISYNAQLKIPHEISNLEKLLSLNYNGVQDPIVDELEVFKNIKDKLIILQQEHSSISPTLKLAFVGDEDIDLIALLTNERFRSRNLSILVVDKTIWCFTKAKSEVTVSFIVWNFMNQSNYISAIQYFLTDNALYVLCWKITTDQDYGIFKLRNWLLRIKDKTNCVSVVIVGCHSNSIGDRLRNYLNGEIRRIYNDMQYYPSIVDILFVSTSKLKHDIMELNTFLYDTACKFNISLGKQASCDCGIEFCQKACDCGIQF